MIYDDLALTQNLINLANKQFYRIMEIDLNEDKYYELLDRDDVKFEHLFDWVLSFCERGNVYPEDKRSFIQFFDPERIKDALKDNDTYRLFYRRRCNDIWRHTCMEITKMTPYDEKDNALVLLCVRDVHNYVIDFRKQELERNI